MFDETTINQLRGSTVVDQDGDKVGRVEQVYLDDATGQPTWVTVSTGLFGTRETFVPLDKAAWEGETLRVPFEKSFIKDAPNMEAEGHLDPSEEDELYRFYGIDSSGGDLTGRDFRDSDLTGRDARDTDLTARDTDLTGRGVPDTGRDVRDSDVTGRDFRDSDLTGRDARDSDLTGRDARDSDVTGRDFRDSDVTGRDVRDSDLTGRDAPDTEPRVTGRARLRRYAEGQQFATDVPRDDVGPEGSRR